MKILYHIIPVDAKYTIGISIALEMVLGWDFWKQKSKHTFLAFKEEEVMGHVSTPNPNELAK